MQLKQLIADDDAVSPVIGVILMVAITVILAAVIGTFVLGLGENINDDAPNTTWETTYETGTTGECNPDGDGSDRVNITHQSGQPIDADRLKISEDGSDRKDWYSTCSGSSDVGVGDTASVTVDSGATVRLIWTAEGGGSEATLTTWNGPDA